MEGKNHQTGYQGNMAYKTNNPLEMTTHIEVKSSTNWLITFVMGIGLLICAFIILIILPIATVQENFFLWILQYIITAIPFIGFSTLFLYFRLWNTFGKTVISIEPDGMTLRYKNKLFTKPKTFLKSEIKDIELRDLTIERNQLGTRYHFSLSGKTYSVLLVKKDEDKRIIDWITEDKASEIVDKIKNAM